LRTISASIIHGSGIGLPSYVVTASDLHSVMSSNVMSKYADDTYLIIPADNLQSCQEEIANVESWTNHNNLKLNHAKSAEIIFVRPRSKRAVQIPTCSISGFVRIELIKVLGVTISRKFSVAKHVDELLTSCAQSLFALRTLRQHGLPTEALQAVFQAIVVNKLSYASPHGGVSPQRMIECVWRRSFDDAIDSDIVMTLLGRLTASVLMLMSVCSPASPATADICCTLFCCRNRSNTMFYANDLMATNLRNTHPVSMTVIF